MYIRQGAQMAPESCWQASSYAMPKYVYLYRTRRFRTF